MIYYICGAVLLLSFLISYFMVPVSINFANKKGILDNPNKDDRRVHKVPTPRIGGIAIVSAILISVLTMWIISLFIDINLDNRVIGYVIGAIIIGIMGFVDDIKSLKPLYKFMFQLVAGAVIYMFDISIVGIKIPFLHTQFIDFGILAFPVTLIWVLGITNSVNLIDGLDGLAAGISSISAISLLFIFMITGASVEVVVITLALVGATLGFLPYNFNPAKTFMGDTGSNFLGYTLATVSIMGMAKGYTLLAIVIPLIILGVPVFDMLFAIIRRLARHQKLTTPDKEHIHHRLLRKGFSQRQAVLILYTITSILGILSVTIISGKLKQGIMSIVIVIIAWFGGYIYNDFKMSKHNILAEENKKEEKK
jgi:UDP-GlcNAc:undecaprenyl-phosphate GlcNAc-1-phosphate transferase